MDNANKKAGAEPQPAGVGIMDGINPVVDSSVDNQPVGTRTSSSNEKSETEAEQAEELETEQKLHLSLVLTLSGAAFLNASLWC